MSSGERRDRGSECRGGVFLRGRGTERPTAEREVTRVRELRRALRRMLQTVAEFRTLKGKMDAAYLSRLLARVLCISYYVLCIKN